MTEDERFDILARSRDLLEQADAALEGRETRILDNSRARVLAETARQVSEAATNPHPVERPAGPRDWVAEGAWVRGIVNQEIDAYNKALGVGIAQIERQVRAELTAERDAAIAALRSELRLLVSEALLDISRAIVGSDSKMRDTLDRHLEKINALLEAWEAPGSRPRPVKPLVN